MKLSEIVNKQSFGVSVILPVYNGSLYLKAAIDSILCQTFENFELIIINDGSTDNSEEIIKKYSDQRIKYYSHSNMGLAATLNFGIERASGKYIARQDQDDISLPQRFEKQFKFLEQNSDVAMVGTWAKIFSDGDPRERYHKHPSSYADILRFLLIDNPFVHSSVMIKKEIFNEIGGYTTDRLRQPPEDYELWSRIAKKYKVANLEEVLVWYREVQTGMSRDKINPFLEKVCLISKENLSFFSSMPKTDPVIETIASICHNIKTDKVLYVEYEDIKQAMSILKNKICCYSDNYESFIREWSDFEKKVSKRFLSIKFGKVAGIIMFQKDKIFSR